MPTNEAFEKLHCYGDGKVFLENPNHSKLIYQGYLKGDEFYSHKRPKDLFRKTHSLAFTNKLFSDLNFNLLCVNHGKSKYYLLKEDVLRVGKLMCFKSKGQEAQYFVPISAFYKTKDEAIRNSSKGGNFGNTSMTTPVNFVNRDCTQLPLFS